MLKFITKGDKCRRVGNRTMQKEFYFFHFGTPNAPR